MNTQSRSLLEGPVLPSLLRFSLPVILSMLTTQLYSTVDSMIVGLLLDAGALAAVSNATSVLMIFLFVSGGMELGANLLIAANRPTAARDELSALIYNLLFCDLAVALVLLAPGLAGFDGFLRVIQTPAEILARAGSYGRIYLLGLPFLMLYDLCKQILIGYGDSKTPMYAVLATSALNLLLDAPFILWWGVGGAAAATALAQLAGCVYSLWVLRGRLLTTSFLPRLLKARYFKEIARLSIPNSLQQATGMVTSLIRQGMLGTLGVAAIAGLSISDKASSLLLYPIYGFVQALVVFIAQNLAAGQPQRIQSGVRQARRLLLVYTAAVVLVCMAFPEFLLGFFTTDADAIRYGALILRYVPPTYFFVTLRYVQEARLRGRQRMGLYLFSNVALTVVSVLCVLALVPRFGYIGFCIGAYLSAPFGLALAFTLARYAEKQALTSPRPAARP